MLDYSKIRNNIIHTFNKLRLLGGNKKCIIERIVKTTNDIFSQNFKITDNKIDATFDCFMFASPSLNIDNNVLGSEYRNKIYILYDDVVSSNLGEILITDNIYTDFGGKTKKYNIKDIVILFDCIYMITVQ